ncbi:ABC transporter permease [Leptobacterium flavescens]|uniref:Transport permease protein n=1 Tax=Leptobacterium flavescens TaxID=472055 RepID=A0A6P0UPA6_9FLAO|nr:ABC transporter permease [Leptobacterium flavescens]NER12186.1 ABC transporter permease [Leptobacterium flavescens]
MKQTKETWLFEISPAKRLIALNFKEIWRYRDLLILFVKRDVVTLYKQTVLGPLWYLIQPLFTSVIFTLVFNTIAGIDTGRVPPYLFNLAGITAWNYFRDCFINTSDTFKKNENIFSKVYFPRVIMPLSVIISNLLKFGIQIGIFVFFYLYFIFYGGYEIMPDKSLLFFPVLILIMAMLGLGFGMITSSMTTKYRDLTFLVSFGVQLLMYISAVGYPLEVVKEKAAKYAWVVEYNPMTTVIEAFRYMTLGEGTISAFSISMTLIVSVVVFLIGLVIFNRTEKSFIDTI